MQDPVRNGGSRPEVGCGPGNSARGLRMADSIDDREAVQAAPPKPHHRANPPLVVRRRDRRRADGRHDR